MTKEKVQNGALLIASYGKGYYIYTGLSLFRELPEGVSGYRILANIISLKEPTKTFPKNKTITQVIWKQKNKKLENYTWVLVANAIYILIFYIIMKLYS
jgi:hypothetical protein